MDSDKRLYTTLLTKLAHSVGVGHDDLRLGTLAKAMMKFVEEERERAYQEGYEAAQMTVGDWHKPLGY